ncbi:hypothetical protein Pla175_11670 [Pirellulimonas nuda]|uniref:Uncharacterized protein n=1 Tax=Pirellulimonas nuda TaxID=2528009 RepID=A0A518D8N3_9BACT|nr:hypothetical protein Pla175_11670 [Pirellulimonas nuda]
MILVTVVLVSVLLFSPGVAVFDGHFALTVSVVQHEQFAEDDLSYEYCWTEDEASLVTPQYADSAESNFRPLEIDGAGIATLELPASGRLGYWGSVDIYNHPKFLVIRHQRKKADAALKVFAVPDGRGPRSMVIDLP